MKKLLIIILIIILSVLTYITIAKSISIASFKVESISGIKLANNQLNIKMDKANNLADTVYPSKVSKLEESIKNLKIAKEKYEAKSMYTNTDSGLDEIHVDTYKIHYLWTKLR